MTLTQPREQQRPERPQQRLERPQQRSQRPQRAQHPQTGSVTALRARTIDPASGVQLRLWLDDSDSPADMLDTLVLANFVDGSQPFARTRRLDRIRPEATLLPADVSPARHVTGDGCTAVLAIGQGWTLRSVRWSRGDGQVTVTAVSDELATAVLSSATEGASVPPEPDDERVEIGFWYLTGHGARRQSRLIAAAPWADIRGNYSRGPATALDRLMTLDATSISGRILLLHGPPGTGKTTALRALAREWRAWCQLDFVIDPDRLFAEPAYLTEVAIGDHDESRWRLLLLEDCDELIRPGAKRASGQALSRLLNLTDGLLGQGRRVLIAITTNENIAGLHPAVTRPGRCLAQVEVGRLSYAEAGAWLGRADGVPSGGATLAELLALRDGTPPVSTPDPEPVGGFYL